MSIVDNYYRKYLGRSRGPNEGSSHEAFLAGGGTLAQLISRFTGSPEGKKFAATLGTGPNQTGPGHLNPSVMINYGNNYPGAEQEAIDVKRFSDAAEQGWPNYKPVSRLVVLEGQEGGELPSLPK